MKGTTRIILLSFLLVILLGSVLLSLPISTKSGVSVSYPDALFTATTATCVTGLTTVSTVGTWSVFGQVVILLLVQVGGLGVITVMSGVMLVLHRRMGLSDQLLIQDAFNLNTLEGLTDFIKKVILGTLAVEGVGALLYMTVFVPQYGAVGIWYAVFNAVSAFCNAGIDIFAENSLSAYAEHPMINFTTSVLIILGGLGYIVWWDLLRVAKEFRRKKHRAFGGLTLHSKIALSVMGILLLVGTVGFFVMEYHNPNTIGTFSLSGKLQASFFQSVTTRTAGFYTIPQEHLTNGSAILSLLLMFFGGSPVGTAGGIKTVTVAVLVATAVSAIKNKNEVTLFGRNLSTAAIRKAVAVTGMSFAILLVSTLLLSAVTQADALAILYETVSATATVGLTRNLTSSLPLVGKFVIICTMYFGRVGPISLALAFNRKQENHNIIKNPTEEISVG